jgi:hypothetical protein
MPRILDTEDTFGRCFTSGHLDFFIRRYTTYKKRETEVCRTIDYLWHSRVPTAQVVQLLEIPPIDQLPHRLPASYYPSDHFSIGAVFYLQ